MPDPADPILWAHIRNVEGGQDTEGGRNSRVEWQVKVSAVNTTPDEIWYSSQLPQIGDQFNVYTMLTPNSFGTSYTIDATETSGLQTATILSSDLRVIDKQATQSPDDPTIWKVMVIYGGKTDPLFELPRVEWIREEYQEHVNYDINGALVQNSAFDPISGGMPRDRGIKGMKLTRPVPWSQWYVTKGAEFENTLNTRPFKLCRQVDGSGDPVYIPSGQARIKAITEQEMVRGKGQTPSTTDYYWMITVDIRFDSELVPSVGGVERRHRFCPVDAGFNVLVAGSGSFVKKPIYLANAEKPTEPQFLDGNGNLLELPTNNQPFPPNADPDPSRIFTANDYYSCQSGVALTIPAPGVMGNDDDFGDNVATLVTGPTSAAAFTFNANGSFSYTSNTGFVGYDLFTYEVNSTYAAGAGLSTSATTIVVIRVGPQPKFLFFDRYPSVDWYADTYMNNLLSNW